MLQANRRRGAACAAHIARAEPLARSAHTGQSARVPTNGAKVEVSRSAHGNRDRLRRYKVLVDAVEIGRVKRGETVATTVGPGFHLLAIVIDGTSSEVTFNADDRDSFHFRCAPAGSAREGLRDLTSGAQWVSITEGDTA
jgi:hypothetical protein